MMDCKIDEDRLSELPLFLLHHILSSLPRKDATRTSVLSKQWNSVWQSFPIFQFRQTTYIQEKLSGKPECAEKFEKFEKFMNLVDKSLQKFSQTKLRMEALDLNMGLIDSNSIPMVDTWIPLALHNGVSRISFMVNTEFSARSKYHYPLHETTFVAKSISGSSRFYYLQKLHLYKVYLSENIIRDIVHNCPNISTLDLSCFRGLKTLEVSKLGKLERLAIAVSVREIESVSVDALSLKHFTFISHLTKLACAIQLTSCNDIRELQIRNCDITDYVLNSHLSRFPLLEHLEITDCHKLRWVRISAQWLKSLKLRRNGELEGVHIHAPNLSKFECGTCENLPKVLSETVIPCSLNIHYQLIPKDYPLDSFWFLKLRETLGVSAQAILLSLHFYGNKVSFDPEALRDVVIPPPIEVELLELNFWIISAHLDCAALIDGLLWSCHPKAIAIRLNFWFQRKCVRVLCEKLLRREQPLLCCKSSQFKCWRHNLKDAKVEKFEGIEEDHQSLHLNHLLNSLSSLPKEREDQEVRFRLDWDL